METPTKSILLCACGLTPQIVTETLYALCIQERATIPDEIHIITTATGARIAYDKLLRHEDGWFHRFCNEYGLIGKIRFAPSTIHQIENNYQKLEDIRDASDNKAASEHILSLVKALIQDSTHLHASLAGGRKTMGFYLGMAMQLFARENDTLSHILVSPPFESHPEFFYPPAIPRIFDFQDKRTGQWTSIPSSESRIELARLPFVRLRQLIQNQKDDIIQIESLVKDIQNNLKPTNILPTIRINTASSIVTINDYNANLTPLEFQIYKWIANNNVHCPDNTCFKCAKCFKSISDLNKNTILTFYEEAFGADSGRYEAAQSGLLEKGDIAQWFRQHRSRINNKIIQITGGHHATICSQRKYNGTRYGIRLPSTNIQEATS